MSRALELLLLNDFRDLTKAYIKQFPWSYVKFNSNMPTDVLDELALYGEFIKNNRETIVRAASFGISGYAAMYKVEAKTSFDEFKLIYFLGKAIERRLVHANHVKIAQIHMFSMVDMLDYRLETLNIFKPKLTAAMLELVRRRSFDVELGATGCYLTYKCVATTPNDLRAA